MLVRNGDLGPSGIRNRWWPISAGLFRPPLRPHTALKNQANACHARLEMSRAQHHQARGSASPSPLALRVPFDSTSDGRESVGRPLGRVVESMSSRSILASCIANVSSRMLSGKVGIWFGRVLQN